MTKETLEHQLNLILEDTKSISANSFELTIRGREVADSVSILCHAGVMTLDIFKSTYHVLQFAFTHELYAIIFGECVANKVGAANHVKTLTHIIYGQLNKNKQSV